MARIGGRVVWREPSGQEAPSAGEDSGSDKDVDFRRVPRGDWDADQSEGHRMGKEGTRKRKRRRVTIMLSWISLEFLRVW